MVRGQADWGKALRTFFTSFCPWDTWFWRAALQPGPVWWWKERIVKLAPFSSGSFLLFLYILPIKPHLKKISFISKTKHGLRDSGLGVGEKRRGLELQSAVSMVLTSFDALWLCTKPELGACFLLEPVSGPASAPWLDWQVWFALGLRTNHLLLPTPTPSLPAKGLLQADQSESLSLD